MTHRPKHRRTHASPRRRSRALLLLACALLGACSGASKPRSTEINPDSSLVESPAVGELHAGEIWPEMIAPGGASPHDFEVTAGKDKGKRVHIAVRDTEPGEAAGETLFTLDWFVDSQSPPRTERRMKIEADGTLSMIQVIDRDHKVRTVFEPALLVLPGILKAGEPVQQECNATVYDIDNPKKVKEHGKAVNQVTWANNLSRNKSGESTPADIHIVRSLLTTKFSTAQSTRSTERRFGPEGLLQESYEEKITVFGVTIESTKQTLAKPGTTAPLAEQAELPRDVDRTDQSSGAELLRDAARARPK